MKQNVATGVSYSRHVYVLYMKVSHVFGFGLINAEGMIREALTWTNVAPQRTCTSDVIVVNQYVCKIFY